MKYWRENGLNISIKEEKELRCMRESGRILGEILARLEQMVKPGVTGLEIDAEAEKLMRDFGVTPSFKGYRGSQGSPPFPHVICANVNDQVVHGMPSNRPLQEGDIITVDCGVIYQGFHSDSAFTKGAGAITPAAQKLIKTAEKALEKGIQKAIAGARVGHISAIIEDTITKEGFSVVDELVGHGIGTELHEDPQVPNFRDRDMGPILQVGMTIAIEPIITMGKKELKLEKDGWTYVTLDHSLAVQVEHTIAITPKGPEILTKRPSLNP